MPGLRDVLKSPSLLNDSPDVLAETVRLFLPSELSSAQWKRVCAAGIPEIEARIRHADACKALDDLAVELK